MKETVKFGVFADLHSTIVPWPAKRVEEFLDECKKEDVDFIVQLGDFMLPENFPYLSCKDYSDNQKILSMLSDFGKPVYHVLGNHDCQGIDKCDILKYWRAEHGPYCSFDVKGIHFIVLDCNFWMVDGECIPFDHDFFNRRQIVRDRGEEPDMAYISKEQLEWLKEDLAKTGYPSVLFSHQRLCPGDIFTIRNVDELLEIIENAPNKVVLSVNGHEHIDNAEKVNGIWYYNMNSMSNQWMGEEYAELGRYGAEMDEIFPWLRCVAPYDNSIYGIVTLDENGATVKGKKGNFVGSTPEEMGAYEEGARFLIECKTKMTASVDDRYMSFK